MTTLFLPLVLVVAAPSHPVPVSSDTERPVVLGGLDPVELCTGTERAGADSLAMVHGRYTYRFANEANRERFIAEPERFAVQWGGACGRMGPSSGLGSPDRWTVYDGRVWLFASDGCRKGFLAAPERFAESQAPLEPFDAAAAERGAAWLARAVEAHGGSEAIGAVHSLHLARERVTDGWTNTLDLWITDNGEVAHRSVWTPLDGDAAPEVTRWVLAGLPRVDEGGVVTPLVGAEEQAAVRRHGMREPLFWLWAASDEQLLAVHRGASEVGTRRVELVQVVLGEDRAVLHLDPVSGAIEGLAWRGRMGDGRPRDFVESFEGWRVLDGLRLPAGRSVTVDGAHSEAYSTSWHVLEPSAERPSAAFE